ncbi:MAG: rhodanese-like domain-containing protein [Flavobacteriales bacterium]|nr:rhodanese-like domain-containing protein [Flavobacteriales bacterium]
MKHLLFFLALGLAISCTSQDTKSSSNIKRVGNEEWKTLISEESKPLLVDVRTAQEFEKGHLDGALNIDFRQNDFMERMLALDKEKTLFMYCHSGGRSGKALELLKDKEFKGIIELQGGYSNWESD